MDNDQLDRFIRQALKRLEREVPAEVRSRSRQQAVASPRVGSWPWERLLPWLPLLAAAALIVAFSLPVLHPPRAEEKRITQIRTEFSIPDKNIRIVWVQRDDFRLPDAGG